MIKPIPGEIGYFISSDGYVYSKWINKGRHGLVMGNVLKKLKGSCNKHGHIYVKFGRDKKAELIHRLVFKVFVGEIGEGLVIRHLNDNPKDNRLVNLAIGTQKDNVKDCIDRGNFSFVKGKLSLKKANEIRRIKKEQKISNEKISKIFNVHRRTIDKIIKNETWKEVT